MNNINRFSSCKIQENLSILGHFVMQAGPILNRVSCKCVIVLCKACRNSMVT
jgi:hypothetical protein